MKGVQVSDVTTESNSEIVLAETLAEIISTDVSNINITSISSTSSTYNEDDDLRRALSADDVVYVVYKITVVAQDYNLHSGSAVASHLIETIRTSATSGEFIRLLNASATTYGILDIFKDAEAGNVDLTSQVEFYDSPVPTFKPTQSPTISYAPTSSQPTLQPVYPKTSYVTKSNITMVIVIVVVIVIVCVILSLLYWLIKKNKLQKCFSCCKKGDNNSRGVRRISPEASVEIEVGNVEDQNEEEEDLEKGGGNKGSSVKYVEDEEANAEEDRANAEVADNEENKNIDKKTKKKSKAKRTPASNKRSNERMTMM